MSDDSLIQRALEKISFHEAEVKRLKCWVNDADAMLGTEPRFADLAGTTPAAAAASINARPSATRRWSEGAFFNKPLAGSVRMILETASEVAGEPAPASVDEIHEALSQGSFNFGAGGTEAQKQSIRISLGKNSVTFVRLPNSDKFGLVDWYGVRPRRPRARLNGEQSPETSDAAEAGGEEEAAESPAAN